MRGLTCLSGFIRVEAVVFVDPTEPGFIASLGYECANEEDERRVLSYFVCAWKPDQFNCPFQDLASTAVPILGMSPSILHPHHPP